MGNSSASQLEYFMIIGTLSLVILALGILVFAVFYQLRMRKKKEEIKWLEQTYKQGLIEAELEAKEIEQRRLAIELHDDIGSSLTALKFSFVDLPVSEEQKTMLNQHAQDTINKVRAISNRLLPTILEELGLLPACKNLYQSLQNQIKNITFQVLVVNDPKPIQQTKEIELTVYRIIQELTNNIVKYAEATTIELIVEQNERGLQISIFDNGKGFVPNKHDYKSNSLGLKSIENRLRSIDATIQYQLTNPGTLVKIKWEPTNT